MKIILTILFCLITQFAFAGDYVCRDENNIIDEKYCSVDGADLVKRKDCLKISRDKLDSMITPYYKFDPNIIGTNDQRIRDMTTEEKADYDAPSIAEQQRLQNLINSIKNKLKIMGFTDEEINYLISGIAP